MIQTKTLSNGIRIIVKRIDGLKSVSAGIFVGVGSFAETDNENGISHFIEHTAFKGTHKRTSYQINWDSDSLGITLNAATSKEYTYYYAQTISEHTAEAFEILADLFVDSIYPPDELDKEKGVVTEEINMYEDTPDDVCTTNLSSAYFGDGVGYGKTILGPKANVARFTRDDILSYKKKYYTTDNIVVSVVGDVYPEEAFSLVEKYLSVLPKTQRAEFLPHNTKNLSGFTTRTKDIEQAHLALSFPAVSASDNKRHIYSVLNSVLGGSMSSRLFRRVREEMGLCYTVYSYQQTYRDCGNLSVYAGLTLDKQEEAYEAIMSEVKRLKQDGIGSEEFASVREQIKSSLVFAQESTIAQMCVYAKRFLFYNEVYDFDKNLKMINDLSVEKINAEVHDNFDISGPAISLVARKPATLKS